MPRPAEPSSRAPGQAIVLAQEDLQLPAELGLTSVRVNDPYAAMAELARRPLVYRALVISLQSIYLEELAIISTLKRRLPHLAIYLTHAGQRQATLDQALELGADGVFDAFGLNRARPESPPAPPVSPRASVPQLAVPVAAPIDDNTTLTADELRALLHGDFGTAAPHGDPL